MSNSNSNNVTRHTLDNGMIVLLKEVHSAPIISWWVRYRIGSRNEHTGQTGISHWVEHMMFKGTPQFPASMLDRAIDREGGSWNAHTGPDHTAYFETMPADRIDLALRLEADRMVNALFDPEEVASERTVIISERQGMENQPMFWLGEEIQAAAFRVHGYHHEIIGDMADLLTMTRDDLYGHYQKYYAPNNAIAIAVGDFDSDEMLARIKELYGPIPKADTPPLFVRAEPEQMGERRVTVERPGNTAFLQVGFRIPDATHDDWFTLNVLDAVLNGASGPGGSVGNKTSRLYKALVETEVAAGVDGGVSATLDPYLYAITVTVRDGHTLEEAEAALNTELERIRDEDITEAELNKAKKQSRALFAYGNERVCSQAYWLGFAEHIGNHQWMERYMERIEATTIADVRAVAQRYLRPQNRTTGWLVPTGIGDGEDEMEYDDGEE
jgi:zinc protease